ncbi:gmc oxidoreductase [Stemphylium lycopersici]|uniref:Gmc oxidoreductase n=1 Tax=Stemphylium lycopersici TaxID=183478 RepID=A0A364MYJ9_STELY|nr:gmc oxidoreductase [Stemphylium lycopersici]RAQ99350.1 gmc oxidoreductase [Stemphylium lycopersici]RAR07147.1 gmc oxidoreductase [Stemphylium lycopersici]
MTKFWTLFLSSGLLLVEALVLPPYASLVSSRAVQSANYDFVIVGGGASGLVLADRLTEDPKVNVLVIEAGPFDQGEDGIRVPGAWNPVPYFWPGLMTEPLAALNGRTEQVVVGKGENFNSPDPAFAAASNISWDNSVRGNGGPLQYGYANYNYPGSGHWWSAAKSAGIKSVRDPSSGVNAGLFWVPTVLEPKTQTRCSARVAHYDRISTRPNYHVLVEHQVAKILFKGTRGIGVQYLGSSGSNTSTVFASKEIILTAGAVHTPQILQLSGIGPEKVLKSLGIPIVADLPGVGTNFQDHASISVQYNFSNLVTPNAGSIAINATFATEQRALYDNHLPSAFTVVRGLGSTFGALSFRDLTNASASIISDARKQDAAASLSPNEHRTVVAGYKAQRNLLIQQLQNPDMAVSVTAWDTFSSVMVAVLKPFSRGKVTIKSTDVRTEPKLDYRTATDPSDLPIVIATLRKLRQIMSAPEMAAMGTTEAAPLGAHIQSDDEFEAALRDSLTVSSAHQCCSAPMMPLKLGGVVDSQHNVYGVTGLRIADVSTFPMAVSGGPAANVYAVAEKVADIVKKTYRLT